MTTGYWAFLPGCSLTVLFFAYVLCCVDWMELAKGARYGLDYFESAELGASMQPQDGMRGRLT